MSNMSELDARIGEAIERVKNTDVTTWQGDESRTSHGDGTITYVATLSVPEGMLNEPMYVAHTYRDGALLHGPDFDGDRDYLMGGQS